MNLKEIVLKRATLKIDRISCHKIMGRIFQPLKNHIQLDLKNQFQSKTSISSQPIDLEKKDF